MKIEYTTNDNENLYQVLYEDVRVADGSNDYRMNFENVTAKYTKANGDIVHLGYETVVCYFCNTPFKHIRMYA